MEGLARTHAILPIWRLHVYGVGWLRSCLLTGCVVIFCQVVDHGGLEAALLHVLFLFGVLCRHIVKMPLHLESREPHCQRKFARPETDSEGLCELASRIVHERRQIRPASHGYSTTVATIINDT
jgi:hypothetical protein